MLSEEDKTQIPLEPTDSQDPASNGTGIPQQDNAQAEPAVVETSIPVEKPAESVAEEIPVDTVPEIASEPEPVEQAQEEASVVEPPVEPTNEQVETPKTEEIQLRVVEEEPIAPMAQSVEQQPEPPPQPQNKITPQDRTSPVAPPSFAPPRGTTFSRDFVQKLLVKARAKIQERKRKKLDKIILLLEVKPQITNKDIQKMLRISSATAVRYLDILERENRIKQIGNTGKSVFYTKI